MRNAPTATRDFFAAAELELADDEAFDPLGTLVGQGSGEGFAECAAAVVAACGDSDGDGVEEVTGLDVVAIGTGIDELVGEGYGSLGGLGDQRIDGFLCRLFVDLAEDAALGGEREGVEECLDVHGVPWMSVSILRVGIP